MKEYNYLIKSQDIYETHMEYVAWRDKAKSRHLIFQAAEKNLQRAEAELEHAVDDENASLKKKMKYQDIIKENSQLIDECRSMQQHYGYVKEEKDEYTDILHDLDTLDRPKVEMVLEKIILQVK